MTTIEIIMTAAVAMAPIVSVIVALIVARRNKDKDVKSEGKLAGAMQSDIGYIKSGIDDVKVRLDKIDCKQDDMLVRLTAVETRLNEHLKDRAAHGWNK